MGTIDTWRVYTYTFSFQRSALGVYKNDWGWIGYWRKLFCWYQSEGNCCYCHSDRNICLNTACLQKLGLKSWESAADTVAPKYS